MEGVAANPPGPDLFAHAGTLHSPTGRNYSLQSDINATQMTNFRGEGTLTLDHLNSFLEPESNLELLLDHKESNSVRMYKASTPHAAFLPKSIILIRCKQTCVLGLCMGCVGMSTAYLGPLFPYVHHTINGISEHGYNGHDKDGNGYQGSLSLSLLSLSLSAPTKAATGSHHSLTNSSC